jgi:hypothetical protein
MAKMTIWQSLGLLTLFFIFKGIHEGFAVERWLVGICQDEWGSLLLFCGWEGKNKINWLYPTSFPSNLYCPIKKLNPFYFQFITIVSVCSSVFLHLLPTDLK